MSICLNVYNDDLYIIVLDGFLGVLVVSLVESDPRCLAWDPTIDHEEEIVASGSGHAAGRRRDGGEEARPVLSRGRGGQH